MKSGKYYWDLKITETEELFKKRPEWMGNYDNDFPSAAFIKGLIKEYKPKNILEVGTAAGWAAYYMLDEAIKYNKNAKLTSVDLDDRLYYDKSKKIGDAFFETAPELAKNWELKTKTYLVDLVKDYDKKFDFVFIDACHLQPWASLDFLAVLPFLKKGAIVVFHDVMLNQITLGLQKADRHPDGVVTYKDNLRGAYVIYKCLEDDMVLSYDEITPNIAAIRVTDAEKMLSKIYCALQVEWEEMFNNEVSSMEFYSVLIKHINLVGKHFGSAWAKDFSSILFGHYNVLKEKFNAVTSKREEQISKLKDGLQGKKTVIWGASAFAKQLIETQKIDFDNIIGIVDKNSDRKGEFVGKYQVYSASDLAELKPEYVVPLVLNAPGLIESIKQEIANLGLNTEVIDILKV